MLTMLSLSSPNNVRHRITALSSVPESPPSPTSNKLTVTAMDNSDATKVSRNVPSTDRLTPPAKCTNEPCGVVQVKPTDKVELDPKHRSIREIIVVGSVVSIWFLLSVTISNINKWIFTQHNFQYPLFLSAWQMMIAYLMNAILLYFTPLKRYHTPVTGSVKKQIIVLSLIFSVALAFGNVGLKYLYVSFAKMLYATAPAVTVFLSRAVSGAHYSQGTYTSLIPLCCGTILCAVGEGRSFHWVGFICTAVSVVLAGLKSILQGERKILLLLDYSHHPIGKLLLLYYLF